MKFFKKSDIIVVASIVLIAVVTLLIFRHSSVNKPAKAEIYYGNTLVKTVDLLIGVERSFSIPGHENVVFHLGKDGSIRFEESDCPDKICIKAGKLSMVGQSAACLPNKMFVKIVPAGDRRNDNDPDIIIGAN